MVVPALRQASHAVVALQLFTQPTTALQLSPFAEQPVGAAQTPSLQARPPFPSPEAGRVAASGVRAYVIE